MFSLPKLAVLGIVVTAVGALQFAVPAFVTHQQGGERSTKAKVNLSVPVPRNMPISDHHNAQSGSFYLIDGSPNESADTAQYLLSPMLQTKVDIKVTGMVARTKLTQVFKNASEQWVNGLYVFPLPENAAVDHLLMKVGDRQIEGQIKPKSEAKKIFEQAKAEGKKASLVAQQRPNMFSNAISNIGPKETIEVSIEYQQSLTFDEGQYSLRFPMTITPRYFPEGSLEKVETVEHEMYVSAHTINNINLNINLQAGFDIQHITSEFHPIQRKQLSDGSFHIRLAEDTIANQDFVLTWRPELGATPQTTHFSQWVNGEQYGLIMFLPPKLQHSAQARMRREVIFVLDTSGSMQGDSLTQAKQALTMAIEQLGEGDTFNLIEFNSYAQNLWKVPRIADQVNKDDAKQFVHSLSANGGTEMKSALNLALANSSGFGTHDELSNRLRQIIFMTDGSVGNEESLMKLISDKLANSRLFTVGIGSAPNSYFMHEAAKMGKGTFTYIGSVIQVQEKMQALLTKLSLPALTDIELALDTNSPGLDSALEFYPNIIHDLYDGEPLVVSYKLANVDYEEDYFSHLKVKANYQSQPWENDLSLGANTRQSGLNVLWARQKIAQLTRDKRRASIQPNASHSLQDEFKSLITETALNHHLVSQYTSLVAVDITPSLPIDVTAQNTKMENMLPKGTLLRTAGQAGRSLGQLPQTATPAQLKMILGLILLGLVICIHLLTKSKVYARSSIF